VSLRAGIVKDCDYSHTDVKIPLDPGLKRALKVGVFMTGVSYHRYDNGKGGAR
jgi:hypothetical protein